MAGRAVILLLALVACSNAIDFLNGRIIGGDIAPKGLAPFAVSLRTGLLIKSHFCGGSLVSPRHVVTAAHCVDAVWNTGIIGGGSLSSQLQVLSGTLITSSGGVKSTVARNFTHPAWDTNNIKNDIGIFELTTALIIDADTAPIPVLSDLYVGHEEKLTAVGWGLTKYPGISGSTVLKYLNTFSLGHEECVVMRDATAAQYPGFFPLISLGELCTYHSVGQGVCQGDSGSALFNTEGLVGIVSWGLPCANGAADVFTRVSFYGEWIEAILA